MNLATAEAQDGLSLFYVALLFVYLFIFLILRKKRRNKIYRIHFIIELILRRLAHAYT